MRDFNHASGTDAEQTEWIAVEIVYAKPEEQILLGLKLPKESTVADAIAASGFLSLFPEIDLAVNPVGIFGRACKLEQRLKPNDRVEVYRPLLHDPKDNRRLRAAKR